MEKKKQSKEFYDAIRREAKEKQQQKKQRTGKTLEERLHMLPDNTEVQGNERPGFLHFGN